MKYLPNIAGAILGLLFIAFSSMVLFHLVQMPPPPAGTPVAMFMGVFAPSGWLTLVKILELLGGILVAIPLTRNFGLLILGPIIINILAYHVLVAKEGYFGPDIILIVVLTLYLLWSARGKFLALANK